MRSRPVEGQCRPCPLTPHIESGRIQYEVTACRTWQMPTYLCLVHSCTTDKKCLHHLHMASMTSSMQWCPSIRLRKQRKQTSRTLHSHTIGPVTAHKERIQTCHRTCTPDSLLSRVHPMRCDGVRHTATYLRLVHSCTTDKKCLHHLHVSSITCSVQWCPSIRLRKQRTNESHTAVTAHVLAGQLWRKATQVTPIDT